MEAWMLDEGVKLARAVTEPAGKAGFQVTLGGSVLLRGKSVKDIDLFFIPKAKSSNPMELAAELEKLWGPGTKIDLKFEERSRRQLEQEEADLNQRFNSPPTSRPSPSSTRVRDGSRWAAAIDFGSGTFQSVNGYNVEPNEPRDIPYSGGPNLPGGYRFVMRDGGRGRVVVVRDQQGMIDEDSPASVASAGFPSDGGETAAATKPTKKSETAREPFRLALMFMRKDDRIDAFIV